MPGCGAGYRRRMRRLLAALVVFGWPVVIAGPAAASVEGECTATFNGVAVDLIDGLGNPLELDAGDTLVFSGSAPAGTTAARIALVAGPIEVDSASTAYPAPSGEFTATIDLDDIAPRAVGLFRIRGTADGCRAEAWLRITGRFPLATLAGLTGAGLAIGGLAGQLGAIASRRRWTGAAAAAAGVFTGAGATILGQQFGRLQPSYWALGGCIAAASVSGLVLTRLVGAAARERRRRRREHPAMGTGTAQPLPVATAEPATHPTRVQPPAPAEPPALMPYWSYVLSEIEVFDLTDHTRVIGMMKPGTWYLVKREVGSWVHVAGSPGPEGWALKHAVNRQG